MGEDEPLALKGEIGLDEDAVELPSGIDPSLSRAQNGRSDVF